MLQWRLPPCVILPISDPAGIAVRALAIDAVAVVAVFARWAFVQTVLSEETRRAHLIAFSSIPSALAGHTSTLRDLTGLLAFTVTAPARNEHKKQTHS